MTQPRHIALALATALSLPPSLALAQETTSLAQREAQITGGSLALIAYLVLWAIIFGVVFTVVRKQRALTRELDELERRMDEVFDEVSDS